MACSPETDKMYDEPKYSDTYRLAKILDKHEIDHYSVETAYGSRIYPGRPDTLGDMYILAPMVGPHLIAALDAGGYSMTYVFSEDNHGDECVKIWVRAED